MKRRIRGRSSVTRCCLECEAEFRPWPSNLRKGTGFHCSRKCGMAHFRKHGFASREKKDPTYNSWANMLQRCSNPKHPKWKDYGARGIVVCAKWVMFAGFLEDMGARPKNLTLERKNVDGNYDLENCIWATNSRQARNKRYHVRLTFNGVTKILQEWCEITGICQGTLWHRINVGWPVERALTERPRRTGR